MHLSPHDCDLLVAELAPAPRAAELRAHVASCSACATRLAEAEAERAAFLVQNPPAARVAALLTERPPQPKRMPWWIFGSGFGAVAAAAVAVLLLTRTPPPETETRFKGEALTCRLTRGGDTVAVLTPHRPHPALEGDRVVCTAAPTAKGAHIEVWSGAVRLTATVLDGPAQLPRDFVASGHGEMRLVVVRSTEQTVDITRIPDDAETTWFAVVLP